MTTPRCLASLAMAAAILFASLTPVFAADKPAKVSGLITLNGKPLAEARIFFHVKQDQFVGANVNDEGKFAIDGAPIGEWLVTIEGKSVPEKYGSEKTSGLRVAVEAGANMFNFELRD